MQRMRKAESKMEEVHDGFERQLRYKRVSQNLVPYFPLMNIGEETWSNSFVQARRLFCKGEIKNLLGKQKTFVTLYHRI